MTFSRRKTLIACLILVSFASIANACGGSNDKGTGPIVLYASHNTLWEMQLGKQPRTIFTVDEATYLMEPALSHDGKQLAYALQLPLGAQGSSGIGIDLFVSRRDGKDRKLVAQHKLTAEALRDPVWLPDDSGLIFEVRSRTASKSDNRIEQVDLRTGTRTRLIENATHPALSPDGKTLAYVEVSPNETETLMAYDMTTKATRPLGDTSQLKEFVSLEWSPDGEWLAFIAADKDSLTVAPAGERGTVFVEYEVHGDAQDLWAVHRDGGGLRRVNEIANNTPGVCWSPDGTKLYVVDPVKFWLVDFGTGEKEELPWDAEPFAYCIAVRPK
ncbi:MAG TPA: hypothetical protein VI759_02285 [Dehalococcoidia bacterium]|nr:hypothetical protein [Dehalococcoidia bacterium]